MRRMLAALGLVTAGALATACASPLVGDVCPAIGYITQLEVDARDIPAATWVQLCFGATCSTAPGTADVEHGLIGEAEQDGVWTFAFLNNTAPDAVTIRVTGADGAVLHESEHRIDWTHSTARCGGPSTADPIVLVS